jgi:hypothetical protein
MGYVATRPEGWETPAIQTYAKDFPAAAMGRDQLQYAVVEPRRACCVRSITDQQNWGEMSP